MATRYGHDRPLEADELVITVPRGAKGKVHIEEVEGSAAGAEITVRVSKKRANSALPLLGVLVK